MQAIAVKSIPATPTWRTGARGTKDEKAGKALAADWAESLISFLVLGSMPTVLGC